MSRKLGIELHELRKVYPRQLSDQVAAIAISVLGRKVERAGGGVALDGLTLSISEGERIGIIGRNGAGKSTLLQMLAGVSEPTSGRISISGHVTAVLTLGIGLREELTGRENIYLDCEVQGKRRDEVKGDVEAIIEFAELGKFIDLPLRTYSTGMKARLAFAMITQITPEILIIDEALSVGDAAFSVKAGRRIAELCDRGAIVLIVSHSMQSIRDLCNRCLWLDSGKLVMDGSPVDVTTAYQESVRKADEADHAARFRSLIGVNSYRSGYEMASLETFSGGDRCSAMESGKSLTVRCKFKFLAVDDSETSWTLRCIRLDGALISENDFTTGSGSKSSEVVVTYPCLRLAPGLYRLCLEWRSGARGRLLADSSGILEVYAHSSPSGGRPVLLNVSYVESMQVDCRKGRD